MPTLTARRLRLETEAVLDEIEAGAETHISRRGRVIARVVPVKHTPPPWEEIMAEVFSALPKPGEAVEYNPVLEERARRRR